MPGSGALDRRGCLSPDLRSRRGRNNRANAICAVAMHEYRGTIEMCGSGLAGEAGLPEVF
jgi:hypothetical protein